MKIAKFSDQIFNANFMITFGKMKDMKKWYQKHNADDEINKHWGAFAERLEDSKGNLIYHMHFDTYGFTTVVHETHHIALYVLSDRRLPLSEETRECHAYYQDWLAGKVRDHLEKWTSKKKKK